VKDSEKVLCEALADMLLGNCDSAIERFDGNSKEPDLAFLFEYVHIRREEYKKIAFVS